VTVTLCNLTSLTKGQAAIIAITRAMRGRTGNLPALPGIYPDYNAPIVRNAGGERELALAPRGMPSSKPALFEAAKKRAQKLEARPAGVRTCLCTVSCAGTNVDIRTLGVRARL
jgi:hypothetical protein